MILAASDIGNALSVLVRTIPWRPVGNRTDTIALSFGALTITTMSCFPSV